MTASPGSPAGPAPDPGAVAPLWTSPPALLAFALVLLRLAYLAFPNLFPEEAYYWLYARHLDFGYLDHPPMVAWLIALGTALFGDTEFGVRIFALACSLVTLGFVFKLTALLYDRRTAAVALLLTQVLPFYFLTGFVMTPDAPLTACWAGMLYFLACAVFRQRTWAWLGVGLCLGLGMLSKYTIALLGPATLLFLALDPVSRVWFRRAAPYLGVALSVAIFSPVIWWNEVHHWASFAFQTTGRTRARRHFALHELAGSIAVVLTPLGIYLAGWSLLAPVSPSTTSDSVAQYARRRRLFARVYTLVPLSVFVFFSLAHRVKLNWTGPLWLAVLPAGAALLAGLANGEESSPDRRWLRYAWHGTVAFCIVAFAVFLNYLAFGLPGVKYSRNVELLPVGWPDLTKALARQKFDLERTVGGPVYIVGMDRNFVASEASFYQSDRTKALRETTGAHLFGADSLMFRSWFPPEQITGATLLLVSFDHRDLKTERLAGGCESLDPVEKATLLHGGKPIRPYYTRVVHGYHVPPKSVRKQQR